MDKVRERLRKATTVLDEAGLLYAVAGGNAVAAWVGQVDEAVVRNTQDVDVLLRRADLPPAITALEAAGFVYRHVAGMDIFLDTPGAKVQDAVHVVFAGEKVREHEVMSNPDVSDSERAEGGFRVLSLQALVQIKLTAYRRKDQVHLQDMIGVGLIDETWVSRFPTELGERLQVLLDDPDG
ncbi:MAG: hypothetical protein H7145_21565 [Akkermansiaceae bacterium]|nr:hypothetical protein [Armatimonadota bacterium]